MVDMGDNTKIPDILHEGDVRLFCACKCTLKMLIFTQITGMATELTSLFEQAVSDSKDLRERPSNETLLQLYSLYKQATEGDAPEDGPSNPFDFVAKAKYEAWAALKGKAKETAMQEYIHLISKLKS